MYLTFLQSPARSIPQHLSSLRGVAPPSPRLCTLLSPDHQSLSEAHQALSCLMVFATALPSAYGALPPDLVGLVLCHPSGLSLNVMIIERTSVSHLKCSPGTSLVVEWLRIRLPIQGTRVRALHVGSGKIPHAAEQLSPCTTTTEPALYSRCSTTIEATARRSPRTTTKSSPHMQQLEKACSQQRRPNAAKNK